MTHEDQERIKNGNEGSTRGHAASAEGMEDDAQVYEEVSEHLPLGSSKRSYTNAILLCIVIWQVYIARDSSDCGTD